MVLFYIIKSATAKCGILIIELKVKKNNNKRLHMNNRRDFVTQPRAKQCRAVEMAA
jgi:hypothetical protein